MERQPYVEVFRATVGSTVHGLSIEGQDDRDEMGVFIEDPDVALGLNPKTHITQRTRPQGVRSKAGDLDLVLYSLRRFVGLAAKGNPSVQLLLFVPHAFVLKRSWVSRSIQRDLPEMCASQRVSAAYCGYLRNQLERMLGQRGQKNVNRPELVKKYGYDTKYAMHAARLGLQGIEYVTAGRVTLPMPEPQRSELFLLRTGHFSEQDAVKYIQDIESELLEVKDRNPLGLPRQPDEADLGRWISSAYRAFWDGPWTVYD